MEPLINGPGFVEALTDWVEATKYVPPGGINFGLGDEINSFGGGQTLFSFSWDDAFVAAMEDALLKIKLVLRHFQVQIVSGTEYLAHGKKHTTKHLTSFGVGQQQLLRKVKTMKWPLTIFASSQMTLITKLI